MPEAPTYLDLSGLTTYDGLIKAEISGKIDIGGKAGQIPFGTVDSTSTATAFTAAVDGLTELVDGTCVMLKNGVVTSTTNFTLNVNGLGAKPVYTNLAAATRDTTIFNSAYTMLFVYDSTRVSGGAWICYRGYDANTNTIGYQLRTNSTVRNVSDTARYYKLYFTSADGTMWVPASVNSTNNATSARPVNQRPIDPFGPIVYTSANTNYAAGANLAAGTIWEQYALVLGYSFNRTGAALTLTAEKPVYVKCAPQTDGSAIMDSAEPIVQSLPSAKDGKIYIYLGIAYDATHIELQIWHPVYWHDGTGIRLWTGAEPSSITVDSALSNTSENPVQNKVINTALGDKQATLVSGTNIKTVNGNSLLGSGDLVIGSGGGVSYASQAVSIPASAWSNNTATVSASVVTADNDVIVAPAPASIAAWAAAGVYCSAQASGTLTFACTTAPTEALTANVMAFEGGSSVVVVTYSINNNADYVACDKTSASEGETVTVSWGSDAAAEYTGISVGTSVGKSDVLSIEGPNLVMQSSKTFTMPASDVYITAR